MLRTFEAIIDQDGHVRLLEKIKLPKAKRALITILDEEVDENSMTTSLLSEDALATDWNRAEEDKAWEHLQSGQ